MRVKPPVERLQTMLDDHVDNFGAVGVLVGVDLPSAKRVRVTAGARVLDGERLAPSHLFRIGSQTKTFVAAAMLILARDGLVGLDDPVARHLDVPIDPSVTLRHLIMNTSGVPEYLGLVKGSPRDVKSPIELVTTALKAGLLFAPGERFDYSNTGWVLAAMVLDAKAPGGYGGYVRERIFRPLGMGDSFVATGYPAARLAHGYLKAAGQEAPTPASEGFSLTWAYGAGDIVSTCDDMLDFFRALAQPSNPIGVTLDQMTTEWATPARTPIHPASLGGAYALGLERRAWGGLEVWGHPGRIAGYGASTWIAPATKAIVTTAYMYVEDAGEDRLLAAQRYNPALVFTQAMTTAHALHDLYAATEFVALAC